MCVCVVTPERIWKWGNRSDAKVGTPMRRETPKNFFWSCPSTFLALKVGLQVTTSRFCELFRDGKYSLVSFLFAVLLLTVPPAPGHL